jgi:hypothetical protein
MENRYKGLRAPHKIKFGVSGCTRECAEAQGKDVGIIATEKGWNLYVCGNGGMKPRHAELLAGDLDRETLIRYVDRFLMFYVRTADRLQRTSTWRDNLEGGLDYLKSVVIDDKLGIGAELEAEMQHVVDTYEDGRRPSPIRRRASASATSSTATCATTTSCSWRSAARSAGHAGGTELAAFPPEPHPRGCRARKCSLNEENVMSQAHHPETWTAICTLRDIVPNTGVCALVDSQQVAVFRIGRGEEVYAIANFDPTRRPTCCRAAWSAASASASWWPRRSTSTTSTCAPANAWKRPSTRSMRMPRVYDGKVWVARRRATRRGRRAGRLKRASPPHRSPRTPHRKPLMTRPPSHAKPDWSWSATAWPACARSRNC